MALTDLLYLDRQRLRRLLGELEGGVVEEVVNQVAGSVSTRTTARLFAALDKGPDATGGPDVAETINLDDALLSIAEEAFRVSGLLVSDEGFDRPEDWEAGEVHERIAPAQLMRLRARTQIVDPTYFAASVDRTMSAIESLALFAGGLDALKNKGQRDRERMANAAAREILDGMSPDVGREFGEAVRLFFGDQVILRQLPCGEDYRSFAFVGVLATGSLLDDRAAMHAKYGAAASSWTVLSQLATVTKLDASVDKSWAQQMARPEEVLDDESAEVDRAVFERMAAELMVGLEDAGVTGGPRWPAITITPLAIYRTAPEVERRL